ncbi:hypothetical protein KDN24_06550 [Bacillus sp. Bva_UNVM-123]|uniref:hypothetical protein n=1 Tax=Bacillus sp. Bva_UNVM-123 TaxID=2829798 RepID=UPI00391F31AC
MVNKKMKIEIDVAEAIELFLDDCVRVMKFSIEQSKAVLVAEHYGQDWAKYEEGQYTALNKILTSDLMKCLVNYYEVI